LAEVGDDLLKGKDGLTLYRGKGCKHCKQSGYWGRTGIFELFSVNERIKQLISEKAATQMIREAAKASTGMGFLREDGLNKTLKGLTTFEEVDRVSYKASFEA
jgi:type II secretory ATPase GspE/PulE/Tfp pilus assembly ATPase PilB-like protein